MVDFKKILLVVIFVFAGNFQIVFSMFDEQSGSFKNWNRQQLRQLCRKLSKSPTSYFLDKEDDKAGEEEEWEEQDLTSLIAQVQEDISTAEQERK